MIPVKGCDPEINIVRIGAKILEQLVIESSSIESIISTYSVKYAVSIDHIILSLDWLFVINAISFDGVMVNINEAG